MSELPDKRVIACNYTESTSPVSKGSLCYVIDLNVGNGAERLRLLARSRSGRWIEKWEHAKRLGNFRLKTLPPQHPLYRDERIVDGRTEEHLAWLLRCHEALLK